MCANKLTKRVLEASRSTRCRLRPPALLAAAASRTQAYYANTSQLGTPAAASSPLSPVALSLALHSNRSLHCTHPARPNPTWLSMWPPLHQARCQRPWCLAGFIRSARPLCTLSTNKPQLLTAMFSCQPVTDAPVRQTCQVASTAHHTHCTVLHAAIPAQNCPASSHCRGNGLRALRHSRALVKAPCPSARRCKHHSAAARHWLSTHHPRDNTPKSPSPAAINKSSRNTPSTRQAPCQPS